MRAWHVQQPTVFQDAKSAWGNGIRPPLERTRTLIGALAAAQQASACRGAASWVGRHRTPHQASHTLPLCLQQQTALLIASWHTHLRAWDGTVEGLRCLCYQGRVFESQRVPHFQRALLQVHVSRLEAGVGLGLSGVEDECAS